jgi:type IV secretion system protein VirB8
MDMSPISTIRTMPPTISADPGAKEWEYLSHGAVVVERNRWFVATLVAGLIAAGAVIAVAMMLPLEKLVPLAVTVDSHTGLVTSVEYGKSVSDLTQKEAIQRSDVARYVTARETYDPQDYSTHIKMVRVMSDGNVWQQYEDDNCQYNDTRAVKRYGYKGRRRIEVNTALPLPNASNTYQVRFVAIEEFPGSQMLPVEKPYVATVSFRYSERALSNEDRIINPLNFRATAYRTDQEITNPTASSNKGGPQ